jgi:hypothetical protein
MTARKNGNDPWHIWGKHEDKCPIAHRNPFDEYAFDTAAETIAAWDTRPTPEGMVEQARAEQWRLRREAAGQRDVARAACDTMRAERDEALAVLQSKSSLIDEVRPIDEARKDGTRYLLIGHRGDQWDIGSFGGYGRYNYSTKKYDQAWGSGTSEYVGVTHFAKLPKAGACVEVRRT